MAVHWTARAKPFWTFFQTQAFYHRHIPVGALAATDRRRYTQIQF